MTDNCTPSRPDTEPLTATEVAEALQVHEGIVALWQRMGVTFYRRFGGDDNVIEGWTGDQLNSVFARDENGRMHQTVHLDERHPPQVAPSAESAEPEQPMLQLAPSRRPPLDEDYLTRLTKYVTPPDGSLVTKVWTFHDGPQAGQIGIWKVEMRGDDVLALVTEVRAARARAAENALRPQLAALAESLQLLQRDLGSDEPAEKRLRDQAATAAAQAADLCSSLDILVSALALYGAAAAEQVNTLLDSPRPAPEPE